VIRVFFLVGSFWLSVTSGEVVDNFGEGSKLLFGSFSVECRVAAVLLRVRDSFLPEVLLSGCRQILWRLSVGPVACFSCQSSLAVAVGDFWRLWGCRLGGFGAVGDVWRIWGCRRGGFGWFSATGLSLIWDSGGVLVQSASSGEVFQAIWAVGD
jgi:hypothetical protein